MSSPIKSNRVPENKTVLILRAQIFNLNSLGVVSATYIYLHHGTRDNRNARATIFTFLPSLFQDVSGRKLTIELKPAVS
ncbi:hypothetical protein ASJ81_15910 [Methanosarcina spelaei]|uniref:Uncharacterized protein n=1 Tax=Methanosarcina spelaei TaxID=1036679 RepID=A0A2A2HWZ7_9EURY|nr:hypothetical protein ASJ81_15910 [Methanosarcina spelaei]